MELISRAEAKAQGLKHYFTGKPCKHEHIANRFVLGGCCACNTARSQTTNARIASAAWRKDNAGKQAERTAEWRKNNPERQAKLTAEWQKNNPERQAKRMREYRAANTEKISIQAAAWYEANPAARAIQSAHYRAQKLKATPAWADCQAIKKIYADCAFVSRVTGEKHHVDHRYPLSSDWVCGLHVPLNLQILTATENLTKSNKLLEQFA